MYGMTYYYKRVQVCYLYLSSDYEPDQINLIKDEYNSDNVKDYSWMVFNSTTGKCLSVDSPIYDPHGYIHRKIRTNPYLISNEDFIDYSNNPFRIKTYQYWDHDRPYYAIPYPDQTIKLKGRYEKLLSRQ